MPERFSLRNGWTQRTTHAKPASKESLEAAVAAPDYMDKQEDGGVRGPRSGEHLATPGTRFRKRRITGADTHRGQLERKAFKITLKNGHVAIARRRGKKRLPIEILYFLARTQEFERRFDFEEQVRESVGEKFKVRFVEAWGTLAD